MIKKSFNWILLLVMVLMLSGCRDQNQRAAKEIEELIAIQEAAVRGKNLESYMDTITLQNDTYRAEKKSWMRDILLNDIEDYHLRVKSIRMINAKEAKVEIQQDYSYNGGRYQVQYPLRIVQESQQWRDGDLFFERLDTENFHIQYFSPSQNYAVMIAAVCEEARENIVKRYGDDLIDQTIIKIYQDRELLRQSVKLSFQWQFAGWYEYPESIKTTEFRDEETYRMIIEHELLHKLTIQESNNNLPYWFSEGLAVFFSNMPNEPASRYTKEEYLENYGEDVRTIKALETINLETLAEEREISNYYDSAGMIVKFMVERFGLEKVKEIIKMLGQYPYQEGTGAEINQRAIIRFREVLSKVLGITVEQLDQAWQENLRI
ncbi:hypothetical protein [Geosporobacter ferrireducens]|uniref:Peptidase MA-like domain-containing protein n=1 Tax=Geosporobacter ferrireducens TaxID=1424294 RepID=A0A1D8GJY2_9FIRM|nr:hypothetical protein [Geosporobacter ferrireducens]AOT71210.1 hypothetical protein Gferi_17615 [Geosporobacter ferrireducens]MTI58025.1 hypothetical protein [Geosporobacter ferrireducens]